MLLDEDCYDVVLLKGVVLALLLLSALVHEVVLLLQLLGAAAVVAREPLYVGVETAQPFEHVPALLGGQFLEGPPLLVIFDLAEGHDRHEVVVKYPVYLYPLQSDLVMVAADLGGQLFPEVLRDEEALIFLQLQLELKGVQFFAVVEAVLENLQALVVLPYVLESEPFQLPEDGLEVLDGLGLLVELGEFELEFDGEQLVGAVVGEDKGNQLVDGLDCFVVGQFEGLEVGEEVFEDDLEHIEAGPDIALAELHLDLNLL